MTIFVLGSNLFGVFSLGVNQMAIFALDLNLIEKYLSLMETFPFGLNLMSIFVLISNLIAFFDFNTYSRFVFKSNGVHCEICLESNFNGGFYI